VRFQLDGLYRVGRIPIVVATKAISLVDWSAAPFKFLKFSSGWVPGYIEARVDDDSLNLAGV
jgi:hypothetical protein